MASVFEMSSTGSSHLLGFHHWWDGSGSHNILQKASGYARLERTEAIQCRYQLAEVQAILRCCQIIHHVHPWDKVIQQQTPTWGRHYPRNIRGWHPTRLTVQPFSFFHLFSPSLSQYISIYIHLDLLFQQQKKVTWQYWYVARAHAGTPCHDIALLYGAETSETVAPPTEYVPGSAAPRETMTTFLQAQAEATYMAVHSRTIAAQQFPALI